jgi:protein phosphatase
MKGFAVRSAGVSEIGRVRETNEDCVLLLDQAGRGAALYAVADGLGGHAAGSLASTLAVATLRGEVPALLARRMPPQEALAFGLRRANAVIREHAAEPEHSGMATTCTAMILGGRDCILAHVGDSRAYLIRGLTARQLTTDHSLVQELVRHGGLKPADAGIHAQRHVLTRALGMDDDVQIDVLSLPLRAGDFLVLTSDGLHTAVAPDEIAAVLRGTPDLGEACRILTGLANARGGLDNASVIAVRVRPRWIDRVARIAAPLLLAALIAAGIGTYRLEHAYFLGIHGTQVAIVRGIPARILGVPLFAVFKVTAVPVAQIAPAYRGRLQDGIPVQSPDDAESLLQDLLHRP